MRAILLMGGESSRFWPLNYNGHKALFRMCGQTILEHTINSLVRLGIKKIIIVRSDRAKIDKIKPKNVEIIERVQLYPKGMGDALLYCEELVDQDELFLVLNPYHINAHELLSGFSFAEPTLFGKRAEDIKEYGTLKINDRGKVVSLDEKTEDFSSSARIVGIYFLSPRIFRHLIWHTDHYSLECALQEYIEEVDVNYHEIEQKTITLKYPWHVLALRNYFLKNKHTEIRGQIKSPVILDDSEGPIIIKKGTVVSEFTVLRGPLYIGKNCLIGNHALIRDAIIEDNVKIGCHSEIARSIFSKNSSMHSGFVGDSIIGENTALGAGFTNKLVDYPENEWDKWSGGSFVTANRRFDRETIRTKIKDRPHLVDTGLKSLGTIIGKNTCIGTQVTTAPGIMLGSHSIVHMNQAIIRNIDDGETHKSEYKKEI